MPFLSLWLPVVVASVVVFVLSSVFHMVLKHHRADYKRLPNEDGVGEVLRKGGPGPGVYFIPHCPDPSQMKDPAILKKFTDGPVAIVTVLSSGPPALGKHLAQWFALCVFVSFTVAYVARHTLLPGADGMTVLRTTGAVAFTGYAFGYLQDSIWKGVPWANSLRGIADAVVYSIATALVFRMLWPGL